MASYIYKPGMFYIQDRKKLNFSDEDILSDFNWVIQCKEKSFSLSEDPEMQKGNQYLGFIHELTHYYQDLSCCSCIGERIYKTRRLKKYFDSQFLKIDSPFILTEEETELYDYLYKSPISIDPNSLRLFPDKEKNLIFKNTGEHFFPAITYKDLLESYAEIKAWQSIICETPDSTENHKYIYELLKSRHDKLCFDENGQPAVSYKYENEGFDRYSIIRALFISFFHHCKPNKSKFYNTIVANGNLLSIDYLAFMGQLPVEELFNIGGGLNVKMPREITPTEYLVELERPFLTELLFVLDIALTIPTTARINQLIKERLYKKEDFHPCIRFYKILSMIYKYPEYFDNLASEQKWMTAFDDIAGLLNWPRYIPTIDDVSRTNRFFHGGNIAVYQDHFLAHHMSTTMESNNGAIFRMFRDMDIPITLRFPDYYVVIRYLEKNCRKLVMNDYSLYSYLELKPHELYSYTEDDELFLKQLLYNNINCYLYDSINSINFSCPFPQVIRCRQSCNLHAFRDLFCSENPMCFAQYHIRKDISDFNTKIMNIK